MTKNIFFDLDDTLYEEVDYSASALKFVGKIINHAYGLNAQDELLDLFNKKFSDPIGEFWSAKSLPPSGKEQTIAAMRAHFPDIQLKKDAEELINKIRISGKNYSIITDGRSITQRMKIAALGLNDAHIILISDETGWKKPDKRIFKKAMGNKSAENYLYIGDNPNKDFYGANTLGWNTIMIKNKGRNIHEQKLPADKNYHPKQVISSLEEIIQFI